MKKRHPFRTKFMQAFLQFISGEENPYHQGVEKMIKRRPCEALEDDFSKISNDLRNAFEKYRKRLPSA